MVTFEASGRFMREPVSFTCTVDSSRIVISADSEKVLSLAQALNSGLIGKDFTPGNVNHTLKNKVFDIGCKPEISGWLKRVV